MQLVLIEILCILINLKLQSFLHLEIGTFQRIYDFTHTQFYRQSSSQVV